MQLDAFNVHVWALHQYLIGLRRRHLWLHSASTVTLRLDNRNYVYQLRNGRKLRDAALYTRAGPEINVAHS